MKGLRGIERTSEASELGHGIKGVHESGIPRVHRVSSFTLSPLSSSSSSLSLHLATHSTVSLPAITHFSFFRSQVFLHQMQSFRNQSRRLSTLVAGAVPKTHTSCQRTPLLSTTAQLRPECSLFLPRASFTGRAFSTQVPGGVSDVRRETVVEEKTTTSTAKSATPEPGPLHGIRVLDLTRVLGKGATTPLFFSCSSD